MTSATTRTNKSFAGGYSSGDKPVRGMILRILQKNSPEWISGEELCKQIWGATGASFSSRLRTAVWLINSSQSSPIIESTGRGRGTGPGSYRLISESNVTVPPEVQRASDRLLARLQLNPGEVISTSEVARAVYGKSNKTTRSNLRALVRRMPSELRENIRIHKLREWIILGYSWRTSREDSETDGTV